MLTTILTDKLTKELDQYMPQEQFSFHKGRSPLQAVTVLIKEIEEALEKAKGKLYCTFVNCKAFDHLNGNKQVSNLEGSQVQHTP